MKRRTVAAVGIVVAALGVALPSCGARSDITTLAPDDEGVADRVPRCGDGVVDAAADAGGEECDDANDRDDDACLTTCMRARCGDGFVRTGFEACDSGGREDECTDTCGLPSCGDGVVQDGEDCDGSTDCTPACLFAACGDGIVQSGEACDGGAANDDRPAAYYVYYDTIYDGTPIQTGDDVVSFYDYRSASGHTGYEEVGKSTVFLFYDPQGGALSLVTLSGIDADGGGPSQGRGHVSQTFSGLPDGTSILIADDHPDEFDYIGAHEILGNWNFHDNTDGGVIGLPWPGDYAIDIDTTLGEGMTSWGAIWATGQFLDGGESLHATLVVQSTPSACRTDCTIPRCGDGILDAGEVCDDGNESSGDGCAASCTGP